MASKKHRKSMRTKRRYKGGFIFNQATYNSSAMNPYTTYDLNKHDVDLRTGINARNLVGGKRRTKRRSKLTKGGFVMPLNYGITQDVYGNHNPKLV